MLLNNPLETGLTQTQKIEKVSFQQWLEAKALIDKLHADNIHCNLFYADTYDDYEKYFGMGMDTLLTNRMDLAAEYRKKSM